jgi:hypothetical protein
MTQVWALDLPDSEKIVLLALADCADDTGYCWPGVALLSRKCSKSERTVQNALRALEVSGQLSRREVVGRSSEYMIHPRSDCTPAAAAPPQPLHQPPQPLHPTPAAAAPKPSKNHQKPSPIKRAIPEDWWPIEFSEGTESRKTVDGWPPGELPVQVEQFKALHASKANTFTDPQKAWSTWVLNTRKFGVGCNVRSLPRTRPNLTSLVRAANAACRDPEDHGGAGPALPAIGHG